MRPEEENWQDSSTPSERKSENRDGYNSSQSENRTYNREGYNSRNQGERAQRPRFTRVERAYGSDRPYNGGSSEERGYNRGGYTPREGGSNYTPREGGNSYTPREGGGYQGGGDRPYRPRYQSNNDEQGGGGYNRPSYGNRPYNNNREGGYQGGGERRPYNNNREGGYQGGGERRPYNNNREGGYQGGGDRPYRPRYPQQDGEQGGGGYGRPSYGGRPQQRPYNREGGYQGGGERRPYGGGNREGGYQGGGGYNRRPQYGNRQGGYDPNAKYSLKKRIEYNEAHIDPNAPIRLNRFLANAGVCSRREADEFITAGVVSVNGAVVTELGSKVLRSDEIKFHDQLVNIEKKVYVLLNKPKDYVTTSDDPQNRKTVMDLVAGACRERIYPVGRLDRNTTGVLLLTNDGDMASKLTHPKFLKKKVYHVYLDKNIAIGDMQKIADGIMLEDGEIRADAIEYASPTDKKQVGIEIHSGRNRIVRRIFESLGYKVYKLDRVQFAGLTKKNIRRGDWRYLTEQEVNMLRMGAFE